MLKNCTGYANPGESLYIMGASGAGKTSLLNALADRIHTNKKKVLTGQLLVNDVTPLNSKIFGKFCTYVMQDDILFQYFTVTEAITFVARLRLNADENE